MRAIGIQQFHPTTVQDCFIECHLPVPSLGAHDLLVKVKAVGVNPIDYKIRASVTPPLDSPKILGWDAAGIVAQVGSEVTLFQAGDEVYYAGSITRPGTNSEYHVVDERIVGHKPRSLSFEEAAALPLTSITAWEALFDRLGIAPYGNREKAPSLLIIGGAGGVGSIAIQLAKQVAQLRVIATASRDDSKRWCLKMGADQVINHQDSFTDQLQGLGTPEVDYILCLNDTEFYWQMMADVIKPQGKICSIVGTKNPIDLDLLKNKSATFVWEFMFTKSKYETADMRSQHDLLNQVADLVNRGVIQSTLMQNFGSLNPENLRRAHAQLEAGHTIGKIVLSQMDGA